MANPKIIKLGVIFLALAAILGIGLGVGLKNRKNNVSANESSLAKAGLDVESTVYAIDDCEDTRRVLVVPGTEDYRMAPPAQRRKLARRLGKETGLTPLDLELSFDFEPEPEEGKIPPTTKKAKSKKSKSKKVINAYCSYCIVHFRLHLTLC